MERKDMRDIVIDEYFTIQHAPNWTKRKFYQFKTKSEWVKIKFFSHAEIIHVVLQKRNSIFVVNKFTE